MMNKNNHIQVHMSQEAMAAALLSLLKKENYSEITITQICQEANIARQTFYRHFSYKSDVLNYYFSSRFLDFTEKYPDTENFAENLSNLFSEFPISQDVLILLKKQNIFYMLEESMVEILEYSYRKYKFKTLLGMHEYNSYLKSFIISTIISVLSCWIDDSFKQSTKELADIATKLLSSIN